MARDPDCPTRPPASGRYAVTAEGSATRLITEYATRAAAVLAIEREVERLQAAGATIEGNLSSGYVARWREHGQPVGLHLTLAPVSYLGKQRQPVGGWSGSAETSRVQPRGGAGRRSGCAGRRCQHT